jgi:hypothetical protein
MRQHKADDQFSEQETQQRFEKLVWAALNTKPKTLKAMRPKGVPAQSKKGRAKNSQAKVR